MKIIASVAPWKNDLDHALGRLAALGFTEVDLIVIESWGLVSLDALVADFETEASRVEGLLARHGLRAVSVNTAFFPDLNRREDPVENRRRLARITALARFIRRLGIPFGTHYPGHIADWRNDPMGVWSDTLATFREIQEIARAEGVVLGPELHSKSPVESPEEARRLLREFPGLSYTYEPAHYILQGIDLPSTIDLLDGARHIHLRGCALGRVQAPVAAARDELRWIVARLAARSYKGYISLEYLPNAEFDVEAALLELRDLVISSTPAQNHP
jgi:sugar phosphate isomerase/epimerase